MVLFTGICTESGTDVDSECFSPAQDFVFSLLESDYFGDFLRSDCHAKHQVLKQYPWYITNLQKNRQNQATDGAQIR